MIEPLPIPGARELRVEKLTGSAELLDLRHAWRRLHDAIPDATPFNSWEWVYSWWQAYGAGKRLLVLTCRRGGELLGLAPLYVSSERTGIGTAANVARLIGDASGDSDYLGFLARPLARAAVAKALLERLAAEGSWDGLALRELHGGSWLPPYLERMSESPRFSLRTEYGRCAVVRLPGTFDEFLRARPARFRTKLRSLLKRLDEGTLTLEADVAPRSLKKRLRSLFELHELRWRAAGSPGVFVQPGKRLFYAHFVPRFLRRGWLRFYSLREGDRYVAHQLCFGAAGVTYLLQEGFDVTQPSASYGQMLRAAVMRELIEKGEQAYDFLGGYSKHKEDWGAQEGRTIHLTVGRRQWRGWLYLNVPVWREQSVDAAKRLLPAGAIRMLKRTRAALLT